MTIRWDAVSEVAPSILDAIGRTPLVRLGRIAPAEVEILAKVEWYGPTGSVKDRIYRRMVEDAEARGNLRPGMTIIECTTGNAGIACAAVAALKGYRCVIVMPEGMSEERRRMILAYGAELVLTPGAGTDIELALARMREIVARDRERYYFPGEFTNPVNPQAQRSSGEEIWEQTGGQLDAVVGAHGTGGWITGVAAALKERSTEVRVFAAEPAECALLTTERWGTHGVPGISDGLVPPNLDLGCLDGIVTVTTADALEQARRLARVEGILCGPSTGLNVAASLMVAARHPEYRRIVTCVADTGQRYLSGELFGEHRLVEVPERDHILDPRTLERVRAHRRRLEIIH